MRPGIVRVGLLLALTCVTTNAVLSQTTNRLHIGPRVSYHLDAEELGVGVQLGVPVAGQLEFYPSLDVFFVDPPSFVSFNADFKWRVVSESADWLYLGAGLNVARASGGGNSDTRTGLNLFAGAESRRGPVHPFGEFRFTAGDGSSGQIAVGLNFTRSRR